MRCVDCGDSGEVEQAFGLTLNERYGDISTVMMRAAKLSSLATAMLRHNTEFVAPDLCGNRVERNSLRSKALQCFGAKPKKIWIPENDARILIDYISGFDAD